MKTILFACALCFAFSGCVNDPVKQASSNEKHAPPVPVAKPINIKKQLVGLWAYDNSGNAQIEITEDSVIYFDQLQSCPYTLSGDTISIVYPDMTYEGKVTFNKDTLKIDSEEWGTVLVRRKE